MKGTLRKNKGITMIALVITVIVLLILAGVTIAALTGENGVLTKAQEAKEATEEAQVKEQVVFKLYNIKTEHLKDVISNEDMADLLEAELKKDDPDATVRYSSSNETYEVFYKGYEMEIQADGQISNNRATAKKNIIIAYNNIKNNSSDKSEQAAALQEELRKTDPDATATYNPTTGNIDIEYNGYKESINDNGEVEIEKPVETAKLTITSQPKSTEAYENEEVSFSVAVDTNGTATYQWYKNTKNTSTGATKIDGATTNTYTLSNVTLEDNGTYYYCEITATLNDTEKTVKTTIAKLAVLMTEETKSENSVTDAWSNIKDDDSLTPEQKAAKLQEELRKTDPSATVTYNEETGDFEVKYNDHEQIIDSEGNSKSKDTKTTSENNITEIWSTIKNDNTLTMQEKIEKLQEELRKTDPNATVTYDELTGNIEITYNGYKETLDSQGNAKSLASQEIAEKNITEAWSKIKDNDSLSPQEKAEKLEKELQKTDPDAKVNYDETTGKYEITYKGYRETLDSEGNAKSSASQTIAETNVTDAWSSIKDDDSLTPAQKAAKLQEELRKTDPTAEVKYNEMTGDYEVTYNGYKQIIDNQGKSKSEEAKTIAEANITEAWSKIKDQDLTPEQKAAKLQEELKKTDPNAEVYYNEETGKYEITYRGYNETLDSEGNAKSSESQTIAENNVTDAWKDIKDDNTKTPQEKAAALQEELRKTDPNATVTYNEMTGEYEVTYNGYKQIIDSQGSSKSEEAKTIAEAEITSAWSSIKDNDNMSPEQKAAALQSLLREKDPTATVTYDPATGKYEITYKGYSETLDSEGNAKSSVSQTIAENNVTDAWSNIKDDDSLTPEQKAAKLQEELRKTDPSATATYNEETGDIEVTYNGYKQIIDSQGNAKSEESKTIAETEITEAWKNIKDDDSLTPAQKAAKLQEELRKTDETATVVYNELTGKYEITYKGYSETLDSQGNAKSHASQTIAEQEITDAWKDIKDRTDLTPEQKAAALQAALREKDETATVTYDPETGKYEITYKGYSETLDSQGNAKTSESQTIAETNVTDAWSSIKDDSTKTPQEKAKALEDALKATDPNATVTYNETTGDYEVTYNGYKQIIDSEGNAKSEESKKIAEQEITNAWSSIKDDSTLTPEQKAAKLQEELRKTDETATVTYNELTGKYEITYKGYSETLDSEGNAKSSTSQTIAENKITEEWEKIKDNNELTDEQKAKALEDALKQTDPSATVTIDEDGNINVKYNDYEETIDDEGKARTADSRTIAENNITTEWESLTNDNTMTPAQKAAKLQEELRKTDPSATATYNAENQTITVKYNGYEKTIAREDIIKTPAVTVTPASGAVDYNSTSTFTVKPESTPAVNGTWQVTSSNTNNVTIEKAETGTTVAEAVNGKVENATATNGQETVITYKGVAATTDEITITVTFTPSDTANYDTVTETYKVTSVNKIDATNPGLTDYTGQYDGQEHFITVDPTTGETLGGTIQYSTDEGTNKTWSTTNPGRTDYGTTTVYVRVEGDSNHNSTEPTSGTITITSADIEYTASNYSGTYDGASHGIEVNVTKPTGGTVYYSETGALAATIDGNTWKVNGGTTTNPTKTNVTTSEPNGKATIYWIIVPANTNYAPWSGSNTIEITQKDIKSEDITATLDTDSYTYDGNAKEPTATITDTGITGTPTLTPNTDYTISYSDNTHVGTATATITGQGNYKGETTKTYEITRQKTAEVSGNELTYNGESQLGVTPNPASDQKVTWSETKGATTATDAGSYEAYATPTSDYAWPDSVVTENSLASNTAELKVTWKINPKEIETPWDSTTTFEYNGSEQAPAVTAQIDGEKTEKINITRTTKIDAGSYTGTNASKASIESVTGGQAKAANYTLTNASKDFTINKKSITVTWTIPDDGFTYKVDAAKKPVAQGPEISLSDAATGETIKITGTDLTATNAGSYTAEITSWQVEGGREEANNYTLSPLTKEYSIARAKTATATASGGEHTYTGALITALSGEHISWVRGDISGTDVGTYTAYAQPLANYAWPAGTVDADNNEVEPTAELKVTWKITPKTISATTLTIEDKEDSYYVYDGTSKTPDIEVVDSTTGKTNKTLVKDTDYTVSYSEDTTNVGTKIITITGINNYKDTNSTTYTITQAGVTISGVPTGSQYVAKGSTKSFTATSSVEGTWSVTSSKEANISITTGATAGTTDSPVTSDAITYKGETAADENTSITVTFTPKSSNYSAPTAKTFNVRATEITTTEDNVTLTYEGDSKDISLTTTNAGTLSIKEVKPNDTYVDASIAGNTLTLEPKDVTPDDVTVTVTVQESNANFEKTINATVARADITPEVNMEGYTYAGTVSTPSISGNTGNGGVTYYYGTEAAPTGTPTGGKEWTRVTNAENSSKYLDAGTYYMYAEVSQTTRYNKATTKAVEFKIEKANATAPTLKNASGTYNGTTTYYPELTAQGEGGPLKYRGSTQDTSTWTNESPAWQDTIPGQLEAGTLYVQAYREADTNYNASSTSSASVTVSTASYTVSAMDYSGTYDGNAHTINLTVKDLNETELYSTEKINSGEKQLSDYTAVTVYYSTTAVLTESNYTSGTTTIPTRTQGGETTPIYWYIKSNQSNYAGKASTTPNKITIEKQTVTVPTWSGSLTYNRAEQTATTEMFTNYNENLMTISGTTKGTNADTYTATFTLTNAASYKWADNTTTASHNVDWEIAQRNIGDAEITVADQTYTGSALTPDPSQVTIDSYNLSKDTEYTVTSHSNNTNAALKTDTTKPTVVITGQGNYTGTANGYFTINKAEVTVPSQDTSEGKALTYNTNSQEPSWTGYDTSLMSIGGTTSGTNATTYTATFTLTTPSNYKWADGTETSTHDVEWKIEKAKITTVPSQDTSTGKALTYNGGVQSPSWNDYNSSQLSIAGTTSGTNAADNYTATFTPTSNYTWSDETTTAKEVTWVINKATPTVNLSATSGSVNYNATAEFTVTPVTTPAVNGTWTVESSSTNVEITQGNGATATDNTSSTIKYKGAAATTTETTITITFTPTGSTASNYNTKQVTYKVTAVNKIKATTPQIGNASGTYDNSTTYKVAKSGDSWAGTGGTLKWRSGTSTSNYGEWTTTEPGLKDAGTLYVQAYREADSNYNDSDVASATISVSSASYTVSATNYSGTYDGTAKTISLEVKDLSGTELYNSQKINSGEKTVANYTSVAVYYSTSAALTDSNYTSGSTTLPTRTDQGETTPIYWYIKSNLSNYADKAAETANKITISKKSLAIENGYTITKNPSTDYTYNGEEQTPTITVKDNARNTNLTATTDYTLSYSNSTTSNDNRIKAGTITVTVTGQGNYTGTTTTTYIIAAKAASTLTIEDISDQEYTGNEIKPEPVVKDGTTTLTKGTDYTLSYSNNTNAAEKTDTTKPTVTITGTGNYTGTQDKYFTITKKPITVPTWQGEFTYNGEEQSATSTSLWNNYDTTKMTLSGTTAGTNAGDYTATFTLTDEVAANYKWQDAETAAHDVTWKIEKKAPELSLSEEEGSTPAGTDVTATITYDGDGELSAESEDEEIATAVIEETTLTITGVAVGETTITVKAAEGTNYTSATDVTYAITVENASEYLNQKITAKNYGDFINYDVDISSEDEGHIDGWKIFYHNDEGTFIIAADLVRSDNKYLTTAINSSNAYMGTADGKPYSAFWPDDSYLNHSAFDSQKSLFMYNATSGASNKNTKACADLMYTDYWKSFVNKSQGATYAIGSPTLEMYCASWNAKGYTKLYYAPNGTTGYNVGTKENPTTADVNPSDSTTLQDKLYYPHGNSSGDDWGECYGYWLSSPNSFFDESIARVNNVGKIAGTMGPEIKNSGLRPVVFLPNTVKAEKNAETGVWELETVPVALNETITANNYGDFINYDVDISDDTEGHIDGWKIFYHNDEGTYIIAADYVNTSKLSTVQTKATSSVVKLTSPYIFYWGTPSHTTFDSAQKTRFMYNSTIGTGNYNVKACSDLLNADYWSSFVNTSQGATYAVGAPTLEMYTESWNAKGYTKLYYAERASYGYYVGTSANPTSYYINPTNSTTLNDKLYYPHGNSSGNAWNSCYGYGLASPSARDAGYVMNVRCNGPVNYDNYYSTACGVRPVVFLPNTVKVTKGTDGVWQIEKEPQPLNKVITADNYGDEINYDVDVSSTYTDHIDGWKIFYHNDEGTYIIASDYVETSKLANVQSKAGTSVVSLSSPYVFYWGTPSHTTFDTAQKTRFMYNATSSASNSNTMACSDLLNADYWTDFVNKDQGATYAIGSPTLEMYTASWNAKGYTPLYYAMNSTTGYNVSTSSSVSNTSYSVNPTTSTTLQDKLYYPHGNSSGNGWNNCYGYWLASPSAHNTSFSMNVLDNGEVRIDMYNMAYYGVRPVVFLPNDVKVLKDDSGVWQIHQETPVQLNKAITPSNYGDFIDYDVDISSTETYSGESHVDGWKIFYANDDGTFIIAADYVRHDGGPGREAFRNAGMYAFNSDKWVQAFNGPSALTQETFDDQKGTFMYQWPNSVINKNVKACAGLIYTDYWTSFVNKEQGATYAIGGPTLEMFTASWNAKGYTPLYYAPKGSTGYYVGTTQTPSSYQVVLGNDDKLYYPHKYKWGSYCDGYYVTSPSSQEDLRLFCNWYSGTLGSIRYDTTQMRRATRSFPTKRCNGNKTTRHLENPITPATKLSTGSPQANDLARPMGTW